MSSGLVSRAVTTDAGWLALQPDWDGLVGKSRSGSMFLTMEWLWPWWRHFRRPCDTLYILVAREGDALVGVAPLYRSRVWAYGAGFLRRLGFLGDHSANSLHLDFLAAPGREAAVVDAFFRYIEADKAGWDICELRAVASGSPSLAHVERLASDRGLLLREVYRQTCARMDLPEDWEAYLRGLRPRFRQKVRRLLRQIPERHGGVFDSCSGPADLTARLESLFELHQRRWSAVDPPGLFDSKALREFYHEMAERFLQQGWLRFCTLWIDGRVAAHELAVEHLGTVYDLKQCFDTTFGELCVGTALTSHLLREIIADGARRYDMLGGIWQHKLRWGASVVYCRTLILCRPTIRVRWWLWLRHSFRKRLARIAPAPLHRLVRRLRLCISLRGGSARCERAGCRGPQVA